MKITQIPASEVLLHHLDSDLYCVDTSSTPIVPTRSMTGDELEKHLNNPRYIFVQANIRDELS